jgi:hypothetical protein
MTLKSIEVEFTAEHGGGTKTFTGWVYYNAGNDNWYRFYEIFPDQHHHKLLQAIPKNVVKDITERILL